MSAVLESAPPTQTQKRPTPVEYVSRLTGDDQEAIFFYLVRELIRDSAPAEMIPLADGAEQLGYLLTVQGAQAQFERYGPKLTAEDRAELQRRLDNPDQCEWLTTEELLAALREADPLEVAAPG